MTLKPLSLKIDRFLIFPLTLGLTQFLGFNILTIFLLILGGASCISSKFSIGSLKNNIFFLLFLVLSFSIGLINFKNSIPDMLSLMVWAQILFLALLPFMVSDKEDLFKNLKFIILFIFFLDIGTNLILLAGISVPWVEMTEARSEEFISRFPGVKGNHLFSGLFSFLTLSIALDDSQFKTKKFRKWIIFLAILNLILAGARRSIIIALAVIVLKLFKSVRESKILLLAMFFALVVVVIGITVLSGENNQSNLLRYSLWAQSINNILVKPITGYGIFYPDVTNLVADFSVLSEARVTESFCLSIAYSFGIPALLLFLLYEVKTLLNSTKMMQYTAASGLFFGLSLELFFGGSLGNIFATNIFFLSACVLNERRKIIPRGQNTLILTKAT